MIRADGAFVSLEGKKGELIVETVGVLASCYRMLLKDGDEEKANELFAEIGREAVETAKSKDVIELSREMESNDVH